MLCCGDREKLGDMKASQKWDYIVSRERTLCVCVSNSTDSAFEEPR